MKTGRPKGPEKVLYRRRVTPEMADKLERVVTGDYETVIGGSLIVPQKIDERVSRLQEALSESDKNVRELLLQKQALFDENIRLKAERNAEGNPSAFAAENFGLKKRIKELQSGILKDAEKMERMETLLSMMVDWELPIFESWKTGKRNELMNQKNDQAVYDQDVSN